MSRPWTQQVRVGRRAYNGIRDPGATHHTLPRTPGTTSLTIPSRRSLEEIEADGLSPVGARGHRSGARSTAPARSSVIGLPPSGRSVSRGCWQPSPTKSDVIVVTRRAKRTPGIGDQGAAVASPIASFSLYTLSAHTPRREQLRSCWTWSTTPTNLLNDAEYLGRRHERGTGRSTFES